MMNSVLPWMSDIKYTYVFDAILSLDVALQSVSMCISRNVLADDVEVCTF